MKFWSIAVFSALAAAAHGEAALESFTFRDAPVEYAMGMLGEAWGKTVVTTAGARDVKINAYLKNISCSAALKAICHAHGLWYREDPESGAIYVETAESFAKGGALGEKKFVEVASLAYPRAEDVAAAIQEAWRDMVIYTPPDLDDDDEIGDIARALDRMDELADRSSVLEGDASSQQSTSSSGRARASTRRNRESLRGMETLRRYHDDKSRLESEYSQVDFAGADGTPRTLSPGIVFMAVVRRSNSIVLRSADREILDQIKAVIEKLDVPKAQVLLEVRVLQLDVTDEKDRDAGFLLTGDSHTYGSADAGFSSGLSTFDTGRLSLNNLSGLASHSVFQIMNDHYQARLNMLDAKGKVRSLATPSLLVADFEASRVFIGTEMSIVTDVQETQSISSGDNPVTTATVNPTIERRDVGTSLVLTPKIHSDGTVTLRVMQENAEEGEETVIAYGKDDSGNEKSFRTRPIKKQIITSSVVAKNGETIALGGLMRHEESDVLRKIPVLGDIPFLGALFRHVSHDKRDYELMVLIRPSVIENPAAGAAATRNFARDNIRDPENLREATDR